MQDEVSPPEGPSAESDPPPVALTMPPAPEPPPAPVGRAERIVALDVLRGFALLGILIINVQLFSMVDDQLNYPLIHGYFTGIDRWIWTASHIFAQGKFISIFSMLFGAGIVLMSGRAESAGRMSFGLHARRMLGLLAIGLFHAYVLWDGDVLVTYAMCGMMVYFFRDAKPERLLVGGLFLILIPAVRIAIDAAIIEMDSGATRSWLEPLITSDPESIAWEVEAFRGTWIEQMPLRAARSLHMQTDQFMWFTSWLIGGLMLMGMALFRLGILTGRRTARFYAVFSAVGFGAGIALIVIGLVRMEASGWDPIYVAYAGSLFNYWGAIAVAMGWIGAVMFVVRSGFARSLTARLAAVGRMALTNYLVQTVIGTLIFYGHGLGLFGSVGRAGQMTVVLGIWALQLIYSGPYLNRFRFGPVEWLWRSVTYGRVQPMRRELPTDVGSLS